MPTRWEITKAVRASDLPAPSRLIMLVLADVAEVGTAEIPQQFTPSVNVLANETGLSKRTVQAHLSSLEETGWIARMRPATPEAMWRGDRVRYRLTVPNGQVQEMPEGGAGDAQPSAGDAPGVVQELHQGGAGDAPLESDLLQISSDPKSSSSSTKPTKVDRPDVEKICRHLADRIVDNGSRRPVITASWRTEARLLLDKDGRTVDQVINAINWCQADPFWRSNILSMPTLRAKYDQLRLAAERQRANGRASPSTTGLRVGAALALADEFDRKALTA